MHVGGSPAIIKCCHNVINNSPQFKLLETGYSWYYLTTLEIDLGLVQLALLLSTCSVVFPAGNNCQRVHDPFLLIATDLQSTIKNIIIMLLLLIIFEIYL